jgi:hypothetical protein
VQLALPGFAAFGVFAQDVCFHRCVGAVRRVAAPHGARVLDAPAAIPVLPTERDPRQLRLWSYVHLDIQADESGETFHPELPDDYPERRPRTFGYCQSLGLGDRVPCAFATCRHSLLSDELRGEMLPDVDLWQRETCSLVVAARGRHSSLQVATTTGLCETTAEKWSRRCIASVKAKLGLADTEWPPRLRGFKLQTTELDGLAALVEKMPERPQVNAPPVKRLTRHQVVAIYGRKLVSREYGQPNPTPSSTQR